MPTPENVRKQDARITELPPEVRRSFILSMVFFPALVGALICALMFLGWWALIKPKDAAQYARELRSGDMRQRWQAARELSEAIQPAAETLEKTTPNPRIYHPDVLNALIEILQDTELDKESEIWSPSSLIRQGDENLPHLRWWAATMTGHFAAMLPDAPSRERGYQALIGALRDSSDNNLAVYACHGLGRLKDPRALPALAGLLDNKDPGIQAAAAFALGAIGHHALCHNTPGVDLETFRVPLRAAFRNGGAPLLLDNAAVALARLKDDTGKARLRELKKSDDPIVRDMADRALEMLTGSTR
jgi:HEAT repeat protein